MQNNRKRSREETEEEQNETPVVRRPITTNTRIIAMRYMNDIKDELSNIESFAKHETEMTDEEFEHSLKVMIASLKRACGRLRNKIPN